MSKTRSIYRKVARKSCVLNAPVSNKQASPAFFEVGGEQPFFPAKHHAAEITRKCENCKKEEAQKEGSGSRGLPTTAATKSQIKNLQGGKPLTISTRQFFEPKFKADFRNVKVHNDKGSQVLASSLNARAFTYKNNIVFNQGQYDPENLNGRKLLAHELAHVVQQNGGISKVEDVPSSLKRGIGEGGR